MCEVFRRKIEIKSKLRKEQSRESFKIRFLGSCLYNIRGKTGIRIHEENVKRSKKRNKELETRKQAKSIAMILEHIKEYTTE